MEKFMNKQIISCLDQIIYSIKASIEYKNCLLLKEKMYHNSYITTLISDIKRLQKLYVKSNYQNQKIKSDLDEKIGKLNMIPLYVCYNQNLEIVNSKLDFFKDEMNDYFFNQFNVLK